MTDEDADLDCTDQTHYFEIMPGEETPRELPCFCGAVTWGEMNDLLVLTQMWEATPRG